MIPSWLPVVVLVLPLLTAVLVGLLPRRSPGLAHGLAAALLGAGLCLALWQATAVLGHGQAFVGPHATWLDLGAFTLGVGVYVDAMATIMAGIVYLLAVLVLLFNRWYMHDDAQVSTFFMSTFFPDRPQRFTPAAVRLLRMERKANTTKAQTELGYAPTDIRTAIHDAYADFARRGLVPARGEAALSATGASAHGDAGRPAATKKEEGAAA